MTTSVKDKSPVAELLSLATGANVRDTDGGFLVADDGVRQVVVLRMIFNWRVARTDGPFSYDRGWCYYGTDLSVMIRAVQAAVAWDAGDETAPEGWDKDAVRGVYSRVGVFTRGQ